MRHRRAEDALPAPPAHATFHEWVLSLPWVVERPYSVATPDVRCFAVECEPLDRHQLWLVTGLQHELDPGRLSLAVVIPTDSAREVEDLGWGYPIAPMPGAQVLLAVRRESCDSQPEIEALVLAAYSSAMA